MENKVVDSQARDLGLRPLISVIVPMVDEASQIVECLESVGMSPEIEVIAVDGGSQDGSRELARLAGAKVLVERKGRALQMNRGALESRGSILLFLHADTRLPDQFEQEVWQVMGNPKVSLGAFRYRTDSNRRMIRFFAQTVNWRCALGGVPYGDQALFCRKQDFFALGAYPEIEIFEDFELAKSLRRRGRVGVCDAFVETSARRWEEWGVWRTFFTNKLVLWGQAMGISYPRLRRFYERGMSRYKPLNPPRSPQGPEDDLTTNLEPPR